MLCFERLTKDLPRINHINNNNAYKLNEQSCEAAGLLLDGKSVDFELYRESGTKSSLWVTV